MVAMISKIAKFILQENNNIVIELDHTASYVLYNHALLNKC